jgi:hypothetical protein
MRLASLESAVITAAAATFLFAATASNALAIDIFTEDFTNNSANWANFGSSAFLDYHPTDGPDGGAYASGAFSFETRTAGSLTVVLRARHDNPWNSSGDAFRRNWEAEGIRRVSAYVKHDYTEPLSYFMRVAFAGPMGAFPGGTYLATTPVAPNTWTQLKFDVSPSSPQLPPGGLEGSTWHDVFKDVGFVTFGVAIPNGQAANSTFYNFGIDKVTIFTPEPASALLAATAVVGLAVMSCRRTRCPRGLQK